MIVRRTEKGTRLEGVILQRDAQPLTKSIVAVRDDNLQEVVEGTITDHRRLQQRHLAALTIQSVVRMWLARSQYKRHCYCLARDVINTMQNATVRDVMTVQSLFRSRRLRRQYLAQRSDMMKRAAETQSKGAKKGAGGKGKGASMAPSVDEGGDGLLHLPASFFAGLRAYLAGRWDEALSALESYTAQAREDKVVFVMIQRLRKATITSPTVNDASKVDAPKPKKGK